MCEHIPKKATLRDAYQEEEAATRISNEVEEDTNAPWKERIERNPNILFGKPVIKGTRLAVDLIIDLLSWGWSESDILENYPGLTREDIRACLSHASVALRRCFSLSNEPVQ